MKPSNRSAYSSLRMLIDYVEKEHFKGYDPYDALNSPLLDLLGRSKWIKIAFTQGLRRLPVNLRPILCVKKGHNPKGIGLFLWGYAKLYALDQQPEYLEKIEYLLTALEKLKSKGYSGNCWGYNFDWQSRTALRLKGTPTVVNSSFIGHALLDCYAYTGNEQALEMAIPIKDFILNDLNRTRSGDTFCFSYTPVDTEIVHNANLLGASLLIRLKRYCDGDGIENAALSSLAYSMGRQREDGSWFYADTPIQGWIDSFHTGFNLQALRYFFDEGCAEQYRVAYDKGVQYYADNFFLEDGTPKYYHNRTYPIDIHAPAQAISFFSGMGASYKPLTEKVIGWMLNNMLSPDGYFYFRKTILFTNKIPYMRWSQAWAFHAMTEYYLHEKGCVNVGSN